MTALRGTALSTESRIAASPVWVRLVDTFTGRGPVGPVELAVELRDGAEWRPVSVPYQLKASGDLAFVDLGRVHPGQGGTQLTFRITGTAEHSVTETTPGSSSVEVTVTTWPPDRPPSPPSMREIRCYPAPDYPFGPGVPLLAGTVVEGGRPAARVRVRATETIGAVVRVEEVRTDDRGRFRLPLRWSSGATQIDADRSGASDSITVNVPDDLGSVVQLTLT